ncbi:MAG: phosphoribosylglycinamide formyltransferase [bacterium]|jgi:phosphoribosylglycinamide formyltransferase-1|nr:phosphoribosylglycinamide formyltransferase [candidate division KSB1 bacterium]MDH7559591.1 phosphoribosylglycinamide formyltransferase [bacterium]
MPHLRLAVLASGRGSNLEAILRAIDRGELDAEVAAVISNKSTAGALEIARSRGIPAVHLSALQFSSQEEFDKALLQLLERHAVNFIALAGYLKMLSPTIVRAFRHRILNIHPALLPSFGGKGLYGHYVHEAVLAYGCKVSGATVHLVDEEYDTGPPVIQECVPVLEDDTPETLAARVLTVEHRIYAQALQLFAEDRVVVEGRRVRILPAKREG